MAGLPPFKLNSLNKFKQFLVTGSTGSDFNIASSNATHTFNIPTASASNRGLLSTTDWSNFNSGSGVAANRRYINYVNGNDTTGIGSLARPWRTIQHAYDSILDATSINSYTIYLVGIDAADAYPSTGPIIGKPNINLVADTLTYVGDSLTITGAAMGVYDTVYINNINFQSSVNWERSDTSSFSMLMSNSYVFGQLNFKQTNIAGIALAAFSEVFFFDAVSLNMPLAAAVFLGCSFIGPTVTFADVGALSFYEIMGGYIGSNFIFNGGALAYFSGAQCDEAFGCALTANTTGTGTPTIQTDASSIPGSITGTPTLVLISKSQHIDFTEGALMGASAAAASNALLVINDGHTKSSQTTAPTATVNSNAGIGGACNVSNATDSAGNVSLTTTAITSASGVQCSIGFNKTYNSAPICQFTPRAANAVLFSVTQGSYFATSTSAATINFANADLTGRNYQWSYQCIETQ